MKPYYEDAKAGIVIYHGDCRDVLPTLTEKVDLVLTDPPYGIGADARQGQRAGKQHGNAKAPSRDYGTTNWDNVPPDVELLNSVVSSGTYAIIWGGNYFTLPTSRAWLVWDKMNGQNGYADCELAWTNLDQSVRIIRHRWMGMLQGPSDDGDVRVHPTQKPVTVMHWCLGFHEGMVLDPFAGSGTTGRACKDLGRRCVMIEREERYAEIAARRLAQEMLPFVRQPAPAVDTSPGLFGAQP